MKTIRYENKIVYALEKYNDDKIINNLEVILEEKKLTASDLAKITGISKHRISDIVNKNVIPKIDAVLLISYALDIPVEKIFSIDSNYSYSILQNENGESLFLNNLSNEIITFKQVKENIKSDGYEYYDIETKSKITSNQYTEKLVEFKKNNFDKVYNSKLEIYNQNKRYARKAAFDKLEYIFEKQYKKIYLKLYDRCNIYKID